MGLERMTPAHRFMLNIDELPEGVVPMTQAAGKQSNGD